MACHHLAVAVCVTCFLILSSSFSFVLYWVCNSKRFGLSICLDSCFWLPLFVCVVWTLILSRIYFQHFMTSKCWLASNLDLNWSAGCWLLLCSIRSFAPTFFAGKACWYHSGTQHHLNRGNHFLELIGYANLWLQLGGLSWSHVVETLLTCGVQIVLQKFLVVTCNYIARALGVPKMASIEEARRRSVLFWL